MRRLATAVVLVLGAAAARADVTAPKPAPLVGVTEEARIAPDRGFLDDPIAFDGARVAYVSTDAATFSELVVYDVRTKSELLRAALPADLGVPSALRIVDATRVFVVGHADDGAARAALIGADGKPLRKFGPATDITLVTRGGAMRVALHRAKAKTTGKGSVTHELELVELDKGKRVGKLRSLDVDGTGAAAKLDLHINQWTDGFTHAIGVKGGHWDPKENQRTPDVGADYDVVDGTFKTVAIDDPMAAAHRAQVMAGRPAGAEATFVRMSDDLTAVELWRDSAPASVDLDQPVAQYEASTLAGAADDSGAMWIALKVDPVNAAAVKRQKADPEYLDLFAIDASAGGAKATRKARILATPKKLYRWGISGGRVWLLERSVGFDRGGTSLTIYTLG